MLPQAGVKSAIHFYNFSNTNTASFKTWNQIYSKSEVIIAKYITEIILKLLQVSRPSDI